MLKFLGNIYIFITFLQAWIVLLLEVNEYEYYEEHMTFTSRIRKTHFLAWKAFHV